jgi:hypothetical protein
VVLIAPADRAAAVRAAVSRVAQLVPFMVDRGGVNVTVQR